MAPSEKAVTDALRQIVQKIFRSKERENLTVNLVRARVEDQLNLEEGYLKTAPWKEKSKFIIKDENERLLETEEDGDVKADPSPVKPKPQPVKEEKAEVKKPSGKRASSEVKSQPRKRQKKEETPESDFKDSDLTPLGATPEDSEDDYVDAKKEDRKPKVKSDEDEETDEDVDHKSKVKVKSEAPSRRKTKVESQDNSAASGSKQPAKKEELDSEAEVKHDIEDSKGSLQDLEEKKAVAADSDSDLSSLIDEEPKRKSKTSESKPRAKSSASKASTKSKPAPELSPDAAEIKLLQSQLLKCGIRKIWGIELKKYGDDSKAKIRHLKSMLREAGMDGRFSEVKAREIKEARELAADLEAVTEGNIMWGEGRESRSKAGRKSFKGMDTDDEEEDDEGVDSRSLRSESVKPVRERIARAKADLAFLGDDDDEEESD